MNNQSPAQEPTMEEILASIRRIISEDGGARESEPEEAETQPHPYELADAGFEEDEILELTEALPEEHPEEVYELHAATPEAAPLYAPDLEPEAEPAYEPEAPQQPAPVYQSGPESKSTSEVQSVYESEAVYVREPQSMSHKPGLQPVVSDVAEEPAMPTAPASPTSGLLSSEASHATSSAFGALASHLAASSANGGGRTLDDLVGELLRPMLSDWLDQNLPSLVEKLVREEIERIARGGR